MKKFTILLVVTLLVLSAGNLLAGGDLTVGGNLDVGSGKFVYDAATGRVAVGHNAPKGLMDVRFDRDGLGAITAGGGIDSANMHSLTVGVLANTSFVRGGFFMAERKNSGDAATSMEGLNNTAAYTGTGNLTSPLALSAGKYTILFKSTGGGSATIAGTRGIRMLHNINEFHNQATTVNSAANFVSEGVNTEGPVVTINSFKHFEVMQGNGSMTKQYGLYINKLTNGSSNYGIALDGDGSGADIAFGANQEASLYSSGGELFVKDSASNVTQISPHDPETGEWVFYSRNTKTGRVVKINMEKLVKAVENLTGEKFMIESLQE